MNTKANTLEPLAQSALVAVYELGAEERPAHVPNLAARLGVSQQEATRLLWTLDGAGLLRAERCRLTMTGLALAVRLSSQRARGRRRAA
jgi:Mn-dependent DtxR family transcriptional regulator